MSEPNENSEGATPPRERDYQDAHYHDDDEVVANDEDPARKLKLPGQRRLPRKLPPRRHYED